MRQRIRPVQKTRPNQLISLNSTQHNSTLTSTLNEHCRIIAGPTVTPLLWLKFNIYIIKMYDESFFKPTMATWTTNNATDSTTSKFDYPSMLFLYMTYKVIRSFICKFVTVLTQIVNWLCLQGVANKKRRRGLKGRK